MHTSCPHNIVPNESKCSVVMLDASSVPYNAMTRDGAGVDLYSIICRCKRNFRIKLFFFASKAIVTSSTLSASFRNSSIWGENEFCYRVQTNILIFVYSWQFTRKRRAKLIVNALLFPLRHVVLCVNLTRKPLAFCKYMDVNDLTCSV